MAFAKAMVVAALFLCLGYAHHQKIPPEKRLTVHIAEGMAGTLINRYAPAFLTYGYEDDYNRIGRPSAEYGPSGQVRLYVDPRIPTIYCLQSRFFTGRCGTSPDFSDIGAGVYEPHRTVGSFCNCLVYAIVVHVVI